MPTAPLPPFSLTRPRLLADLYVAYELAARHKRKSASAANFAARLDLNLSRLADEAARGEASPERLCRALSSYGGVMGPLTSFNVRNALFSSLSELWRDGGFDSASLKWEPFPRLE